MTYSITGCVYEILNKTANPYSEQICKPVCHPAAEGLTDEPHFTRCANTAEAVTTEYDAVILNCGTNSGAEEQEFTVLDEHKPTILVYVDSPFNGLLSCRFKRYSCCSLIICPAKPENSPQTSTLLPAMDSLRWSQHESSVSSIVRYRRSSVGRAVLRFQFLKYKA